MCLFRSNPTPMPTPAPIQPRQPDVVQAARLPSKKELTTEEDVAGVEYGTSAKAVTRGAAKKTGTDALKININPGSTGGSTTGGMNV